MQALPYSKTDSNSEKIMTVQELINKLAKMPRELKVVVYSTEAGKLLPIFDVQQHIDKVAIF
mgnify:CR=1 FL=1